ncbi:MAG: AMMECR1 domain-containing protein [Spirochaetae bacterium HGW-Spirochaetae-1]|jgi:AmmeMemoRadiSam system protein A|nr:MAG: AMMECR1 domain-containing protein [Spirochaetae bacterium HGW-Spirochaetae-1]
MEDLNREQQIALLGFARKTIADQLGVECEIASGDFSHPVFLEKCGAFVTLHIGGNLRGCIGYIIGMKTIPETIQEMALSAAFRDPRFRPLSKGEYSGIDIEISVLSPIEEVRDVKNITVGRDGIIISRGPHQGLLLPQVATEQGWELPQFLEHTCYKAGLPGNAWKDPATKIEKFSAQVFGEKELGLI